MTFDELQSLIGAYTKNAGATYGGDVATRRANLMDRYMGEPYGDEVADRSSVVMTDARDAVEGIKPELMDIFFGGDKVVEFSPRGPEDVEAAEQETEVINYVVNQMNNGFEVFYQWFHDALVLKNGYVKRFWDTRDAATVEEYDDLTHDEALDVLANAAETGEVEIIEQWGGMNDETGEAEPVGIKFRIKRDDHAYKIECVPPEEVIVAQDWPHTHLEGCPFVAHVRSETMSDLIALGFNRKQIEALPTDDENLTSEEKLNRRDTRINPTPSLMSGDQSQGAMRRVRVAENYIRADMDGDGVAELLQVWTAGEDGEILRWKGGKRAIEEVDAPPFNVLTPLPVPHRHYGISLVDQVDDLQKVRTVLVRQLVDNIVMNNNADMVVDENAATETTYEDLAVTRAGRVIRIPGGPAAVHTMQPPSTAAASLAGIEYIDAQREVRTGVTRYNQGLDADSLNKTASGIDRIMSAAEKKVLLIARIFAETGVARLFKDIHRDLRKGPLKRIAMRLRNDWVDVNPRHWVERSDMTVSVGLGTGDRDAQFARLGMILQQQKEAAAAGFVAPKNIHHTLTKMLELSGFKDVAAFFPDPDEAEQAPAEPEMPDPTMMLAQVEMEKARLQAQAKMAELEIKRLELGIKQDDADTRRLDVMMADDRARDLAAAKIEADEAARTGGAVNGQGLVNG